MQGDGWVGICMLKCCGGGGVLHGKGSAGLGVTAGASRPAFLFGSRFFVLFRRSQVCCHFAIRSSIGTCCVCIVAAARTCTCVLAFQFTNAVFVQVTSMGMAVLVLVQLLVHLGPLSCLDLVFVLVFVGPMLVAISQSVSALTNAVFAL